GPLPACGRAQPDLRRCTLQFEPAARPTRSQNRSAAPHGALPPTGAALVTRLAVARRAALPRGLSAAQRRSAWCRNGFERCCAALRPRRSAALLRSAGLEMARNRARTAAAVRLETAA